MTKSERHLCKERFASSVLQLSAAACHSRATREASTERRKADVPRAALNGLMVSDMVAEPSHIAL